MADVSIGITGLSELIQTMDDFAARQMPFVMAKTLTDTAKAIQAAEVDHIAAVFDRPTLFTMQSVGMTPASKENLSASVFVKDIQSHYLAAEAEGGQRGLKIFEQRFADGLSGLVALPGRGAKLDQYGNMSKALILEVVRNLSVGKGGLMFAGVPIGHTQNGIYARVDGNKHLEPLLIFAQRALYPKRFMFEDVAIATFSNSFERILKSSFDFAMRTAR